MQRVVCRYQGVTELEEFIKLQNIHSMPNCFIRIFTSLMKEDEAVEVAVLIKDLLPHSQVIGSSVPVAVIYNSEQMEDETIIIFDSYENLDLKLEIFSWKDKSPKELALEIHSSFSQNSFIENSLVHLIFSQDFRDAYPFVEEINNLSPHIKLVGGIIGDNKIDIPGYIFSADGVLTDVVFAFCAYGELERNFSHSFNTFEVISGEYTVTKAHEDIIDEIENVPALDWLCDCLTLDKNEMMHRKDFADRANSDYFMNFPFITDTEINCGFFMKYIPNSSSLALYHSTLPENIKFRLGYVNPDKTIRAMHALCSQILEEPVEELFVYTCLARKMNLQNFSKWELAPFQEYNVSGIFMLGEFSNYNGKNYFNNGITTFTGIAEENTYIIPDVLALEEQKIPTQDTSFLDKAMQLQKEHITAKHIELFSKIENVTKERAENKYIDSHFNLPNFYQYELDRQEYKFDKICLLEVHTADAAIAFAGEELYYKACNEVMAQSRTVLRELLPDYKLYVINYKSFVIANTSPISNAQFIIATKSLHNAYEYASSNETGLTGVVRYVVAMEQEDLLGSATKYLYMEKNSQENYLICDKRAEYVVQAHGELEDIALLKRTIDHDRVVPYYQAIYNNKLKKIDKYEALMRIIDLDGKIYYPFAFLEFAKKYKFYKELSKSMIEKALADFTDRSESLSINISVYDLESQSFRHWLISKLKAFPNPERIIVEFVETESYGSIDILVDFLQKIHEVGSKVAVDDFGAGYSTLSIILAIKPDFIKLDGSIIKDIIVNEDMKIILETVQYMAKRMNAELVAEFVENEAIQNYLQKMEIAFSQGYFIARPLPLAEIE